MAHASMMQGMANKRICRCSTMPATIRPRVFIAPLAASTLFSRSRTAAGIVPQRARMFPNGIRSTATDADTVPSNRTPSKAVLDVFQQAVSCDGMFCVCYGALKNICPCTLTFGQHHNCDYTVCAERRVL